MRKQILMAGGMGASVFLLVVLSARIEMVDRLTTVDPEVESEVFTGGVSLSRFSWPSEVRGREISVHHRSTLHDPYFHDLTVER